MGSLLQAMPLTDSESRVLPRACLRQDGIALVLVLWMLVLLTAIANGLVFSSRSEILIADNLAALARAEALADAGVFKTIQALQTNPQQAGQPPAVQVDPARWRADGLTRRWLYHENELFVTIIDESGKIDINSAAPPLIHGLLRAVQVDDVQATALVDAMLDWRDADTLRHPQGAEKDDYAAQGLLHGPTNSDFESIDELRQVLGMNESLFNLIEPYITVFSHQAGINSAIAPRPVLLAIPGATPELVDSFIAQRTSLLEQGLPPAPFPASQGFSSSATSATFSVHVDVFLEDNIKFARQATVRFSGTPHEPFSILAWRAPTSTGMGINSHGNSSDASPDQFEANVHF
jgi:general secretion pathway protein K